MPYDTSTTSLASSSPSPNKPTPPIPSTSSYTRSAPPNPALWLGHPKQLERPYKERPYSLKNLVQFTASVEVAPEGWEPRDNLKAYLHRGHALLHSRTSARSGSQSQSHPHSRPCPSPKPQSNVDLDRNRIKAKPKTKPPTRTPVEAETGPVPVPLPISEKSIKPKVRPPLLHVPSEDETRAADARVMLRMWAERRNI